MGLRYTSVGAVSCGRSEMILPNAVGNLQKGEQYIYLCLYDEFITDFRLARYSNMDYIFGAAIQRTQVKNIDVSYDISCEWFKNLLERIWSHWPLEIQPSPDMNLRPLIPKLH